MDPEENQEVIAEKPADEVVVGTVEDKKTDEPAEGEDKIINEGLKPPVTPSWAQKRIDKLVFEREEAKREAAALRALAERGNNPPAEGAKAPEPAKNTLPEVEIERRAKIKSDNDRRAEKFAEACNKAYDSGKAAFKDFDSAIQNLNAVGALGTTVDPTFLETVTELDDAARVINHLGHNPEEASRLLTLSPKKMAIELARLETSLKTPSKEVSKAPDPITPVGGRAKTSFDPEDPDTATADWMDWRNKQIERKRSGNR